MALRRPVRQSSVLMASILNPFAREVQEERWQRTGPDQRFSLLILEPVGSTPRKIPSPGRKTADSTCRQSFEFRQTSRD